MNLISFQIGNVSLLLDIHYKTLVWFVDRFEIGAFHLVHDVENVQYRILDRKNICCYSFPCSGSVIHSSLITSDTLMVSEVYSNTDGFWIHVDNSCVMNPPNSPYGGRSAEVINM